MAHPSFNEAQFRDAYNGLQTINFDYTNIIFYGKVHTRHGGQYRVYSHEGRLRGQVDGSDDEVDKVDMTFDQFCNSDPVFVQLIHTSDNQVQVILGSPALVQQMDVLEE
jgi:hypothetical protein